jgi:hypothetical protein
VQAARFAEILARLAAEDVEFIVVGMTAGILQGVPVTTVDLDIVHRRTAENTRPKDLAVLPYLRATLDEIRRRS